MPYLNPFPRSSKTRATAIVEGMYDRRRELFLVPAYEICVCEWRGAPCT